MKIKEVMQKSLFVNSSLVILKLLSGFIFKSASLVADGIHSLSDLMSDILVLLGLKQTTKPPDDDHPLGHGKFEYVLSLLLGIGVIGVAYQLFVSVIKKLSEPISIPSPLSLVVVLIAVISKYFLAKYLAKKGDDLNSLVIKSSGKESLADVISSFVVLFGIGFALLSQYTSLDFLVYGDLIAGLIIGLFILKVALEIIYDAIFSLLGKSADGKLMHSIKEEILMIPGVLNVDKLQMIEYGYYYQVMIDIAVNASISVKEGHDIASMCKKTLLNHESITHVIVHVNPYEE
ncbi:MAG: cation diffusion facilitator family transporter [Candidatus Izemoplasmataceae bacterium]